MKKLSIVAGALALSAISASASDAPLWLRDSRISPDGSQIAFTYRGDIFVVPVSGGNARQLTSNPGYDSRPVWSPDGSQIAFRSDREGSDDIFIVDATGGTPRRLTTNSDAETPLAFLNADTLIFTTGGMPGKDSARAPFGYPLPYTINVNTPNSRPELFLSVPMLSASVNSKGSLLYTDKKSVENALRKHERSSGTYDVWLYSNGEFTQLTDFNGHDMDPVWGAEGNYYYISEQDGTLNVWEASLNGTTPQQLTDFTRHPVRSLSASDNGTLAFSWDGELYTLTPGEKPRKVEVNIMADQYDSDIVKGLRTRGVTNAAVSPDGEEIAFIIRGDVFVTSTKYKTTRRITDTPAQERSVDFAPDGKTLVYDSDRDGYWQLFTAKSKNPDDKLLTYAEEIVETPLYKCSTAAQQPRFSPDGKKVAFLEDRSAIRVINLSDKKVNTVMPKELNYSYADGDITFDWSPDSQWIVSSYIGDGGWNNSDVAIAKADGSQVTNITESGFSDGFPAWALDGKAVTYVTTKYGMKSQGSWGNTYDIVLMALDGEAWDDFNMTEEEAALRDEAKKEQEKKDDSKKSDSKKSKKENKEADSKQKKASSFELDDRRYRMRRLTSVSAAIGDYYLSPKGDKLYYIAADPAGKNSLYERDLKKGDTKVLCSGLDGGFEADRKGENLFVVTSGGIKKVNLAKGDTKNIEFEADYDRRPSAEREYMYDHMLRQVNDKFYDANLHGVDWDYYGNHYRRFLPYISNNRDFADLLSEILGELNASHTGGRVYPARSALAVGNLGAYFDESYKGEGLKVAEVLPRGPLASKKVNVQPGDIILAIDGKKIEPGADYNPLLEGKVGRKTPVTVRKADGTTVTTTVRPISSSTLRDLLYQRWIAHNEAIVDSVSGGKIGYVHVQGMNSPSYREVYERALGKYRNCDALIVDTRYNGGGWLHNDLAVLLSGKEYVRYSPRGQFIGADPFSQWTKPSVMLVGEANYSDAHATPYVYQTLGLGEVIGAPVPGTMTAVWWETQIDPEIVFGIPQVTSLDKNGHPLENQQLNPDILIYNQPGDIEKGIDAQLIGATRHLMQKTKK